MVQDNPVMNELEEMANFCTSGHRKGFFKKKRETRLYIYGHDEVHRMISKYLHYAEIRIDGFLMAHVRECDRYGEPFPIISLSELPNISSECYVKVIIAESDEIKNQVIRLLRELKTDETYLVSDWNMRTIPKKMVPRKVEDFYLEVNLADHCNLNCQCCDHFSPIAKKTFLDYDQYVKDIKRLASLTGGKMGLMKLQGGEPLLNDRVIDYMKVTREVFPDSPVCLFTDGLLLPKLGREPDPRKNFWEAVKKYEIEVRMTQYPIPIKMEAIVDVAKEHGIDVIFEPLPCLTRGARLWIFSEIGAGDYKGVKHSVKHPFDLEKKVEKFRYISCYQFNESIVLRDGKIYTCPMIPYSHYFNEAYDTNLEVKDDCFIDIYQAVSYEEIAEFCTRRTSFCDYCAVHKRFAMPWKQSSHGMHEWSL